MSRISPRCRASLHVDGMIARGAAIHFNWLWFGIGPDWPPKRSVISSRSRFA